MSSAMLIRNHAGFIGKDVISCMVFIWGSCAGTPLEILVSCEFKNILLAIY